MKLFYAPGACSIGIHVMLEEIGAPYEAVLVNLREGAQLPSGWRRAFPQPA
jgi:glutathione S-transferase